jgi:hypothetical protein
MKRVLIGACITATMVLAGCNDSKGDLSCTTNSDCPLPLICIGATSSADTGIGSLGRCLVECRVDTDCSQGLCVESVCRQPDGPCRQSTDCAAFGRICDPGLRICVQPCSADDTCSGGDRCVDGRCQRSNSPRQDGGGGARDPDQGVVRAPRDASTSPGRRDASAQPRDAARPIDAQGSRPDRGVPGGPDMGVIRGNAEYGEPCRCGADCATGLCVPNPYNQFAGQCSAQCGARDRCPGVDRCIDVSVPEANGTCPPSGLGFRAGEIIQVCAVNETGVPCNEGANCILDGVCLPPANPIPNQVDVPAACAARCDADNQCPAGFRCADQRTDNGQVVSICSPATTVHSCPDGSNRTCGGVCPDFPGVDPVDISHCVVLDDNQPGYCSCACSSTVHCPDGFACSRNIIDTGDRARPGICLPISGYTCPLGNETCLSQGCAPQLEAELFTRCTAPCSNANDCPTGYGCIEIPGEGGRYCIATTP